MHATAQMQTCPKCGEHYCELECYRFSWENGHKETCKGPSARTFAPAAYRSLSVYRQDEIKAALKTGEHCGVKLTPLQRKYWSNIDEAFADGHTTVFTE